MKTNIFKLSSLSFIFFILCSVSAFGQGDRQVVKFSGLVVEGDSAYGIPGVHIYVPKAGRGCVSNPYGYFSVNVLEGDSIIFSSIGFKTQYLVIPKRGEPTYSVMINMSEDIVALKEVEVFPYPNAEVFKEAFLELEIPPTEIEKMQARLSPDRLAKMGGTLPMSAAANYRHYMNQMVSANANRYFIRGLQYNLINPFAWAQTIKDFKEGKHKKKLFVEDED